MTKKLTKDDIERILGEFEEQGLVYKRWDIKKNDYVWSRTERGEQLAKEMDLL